jgi:hypothetical protein
MPIRVLVKQITDKELQQVLIYYNLHKSDNEEPLELLDRCEGGFYIKIDYLKHYGGDQNNKIKQVRWKNGYLISEPYISFKSEEESLLYDALSYVLGKNNVKMEDINNNRKTNIFTRMNMNNNRKTYFL